MSLVDRLEALRDIKAAATRTIKTIETAAVQEMELFEHTVRYQDILSQTNKATDHAEEISQVATSMYDKSHARKRALDLAKTNREKKLKKKTWLLVRAVQARMVRPLLSRFLMYSQTLPMPAPRWMRDRL